MLSHTSTFRVQDPHVAGGSLVDSTDVIPITTDGPLDSSDLYLSVSVPRTWLNRPPTFAPLWPSLPVKLSPSPRATHLVFPLFHITLPGHSFLRELPCPAQPCRVRSVLLYETYPLSPYIVTALVPLSFLILNWRPF